MTIDVYQNKLRIFESGGTNRGAYIDLTAASAGVASDLLTGGGGGATTLDGLNDVTAPSPSSGDFLKYNGSAWVNDPINLGTDTTGNYMVNVAAGSGITVTHTESEGSTATVALTSNSVTINGTSVALGGSATVTANAQTLTGTSLNSTVIGSSLTSVGTLTGGTWNANTITYAYGGTGQTTYAAGDILYASAANTVGKLTVGTNGQVLASNGTSPVWTANTGTGNIVRATGPSISNPTITTTSSNTISTPANTVVGSRYLALTNSAFGYVIESITAGTGISVTASIDPTISINTSVVVTLTGTQTLTNKTLTSPSMTTATVSSGGIDVTGQSFVRGTGFGSPTNYGFLVGNDAGNNVKLYNAGIQRHGTDGVTVGILNLNPDGGDVVFGANIYNNSTANYVEIGSNQSTGIGANTTTDIGVRLSGSGAIWASRNNGTLLVLNRMRHVSGGTAVEFRTDGTARGDITIAGNTVSYNAFLGSHHTEIEGPAPELGTVMESTGEMVDGFLYDQGRLPKCKVSDTISSKAVFGVYLSEHHNDSGNIGHLVAALGAGWVRMSANSSPVLGDLIDSNGDGCAKVQDDDVIKSSTIGKISSTVEITVYDDGSYLLPCVLYCG